MAKLTLDCPQCGCAISLTLPAASVYVKVPSNQLRAERRAEPEAPAFHKAWNGDPVARGAALGVAAAVGKRTQAALVVCGCGHERGWHAEGNGKCGRCPAGGCEAFHKKGTKAAAPAAELADIGKGEHKVLQAIAQVGSAGRKQLLLLTGYKRRTRDTYLQRLAARGLVKTEGSDFAPTALGLEELARVGYEPLPTGDALRRHWEDKLPEGESTVLAIVCKVYPLGMQRADLDEATGYARRTRDSYVQRLIGRRLIESRGDGWIIASRELFDAERKQP